MQYIRGWRLILGRCDAEMQHIREFGVACADYDAEMKEIRSRDVERVCEALSDHISDLNLAQLLDGYNE